MNKDKVGSVTYCAYIFFLEFVRRDCLTISFRLVWQVSLFFTESPTNPFLRCVDIKLVSEICHKRGTLVCIDGTFATPLNQKALALGADLVVHSATKYIGGHNDVSKTGSSFVL